MFELAQNMARHDVVWMAFNTTLAYIPFGLALLLFSRSRVASLGVLAVLLGGAALILTLAGLEPVVFGPLRLLAIGLAVVFTLVALTPRSNKNPAWWLGFAAFVAFLPNSPYVLTDGLHLVRHIHVTNTAPEALVVLIPLYGVYTATGILAYTGAIDLLDRWLTQHAGRLRFAVHAVLHLAIAFGIYVGRVERFHSWHILERWDAFWATTGIIIHEPRTWLFTAATFGVLVAMSVATVPGWRRFWQTDEPSRARPAKLLAERIARAGWLMGWSWCLGVGALSCAVLVPHWVRGARAPGWTASEAAALGLTGILLAITPLVVTRLLRATAGRDHFAKSPAWGTIGIVAAITPVVGLATMGVFTALSWAINEGGVERYLGPERFG